MGNEEQPETVIVGSWRELRRDGALAEAKPPTCSPMGLRVPHPKQVS
jgi:hypothetical protein